MLQVLAQLGNTELSKKDKSGVCFTCVSEGEYSRRNIFHRTLTSKLRGLV